MALTDAEVQRIRYEMGYVNLNVAAEPYIGIAAYFTQILQPYLLGGTATTSATPVTAATTPTPQSLVLASIGDIVAGSVVLVDVDARQERATVQAVSGSSITLQLSLAHTGTYPVVLEGGESIIRDILRELRSVSDAIGNLRDRVGLKRADEVEFFGGGQTLASQGIDPMTHTLNLREYWRDELARCLGIPRLNAKNSSGGSEIGVY